MPTVRAGVDLDRLAVAPSQSEQEAAKRTHESIRGHLESDPALAEYRVETRLQGSYRNSTNVRADSDVDLSCRTERIYYPDVSELPDTPTSPFEPSPLARYKAASSPASFTFTQYRQDVLDSLRGKYGSTVQDGNKAIKVPGNTYRLDADALPCIEHRRYFRYTNGGETDYHRGIAFMTKKRKWIVNFPEQHFENLTSKNTSTGGRLKGTIRIVKRIRNLMVDASTWDKKRSPSYYLECLMWNVPAYLYDGRYHDFLLDVLKYLYHDIKAKKAEANLRAYTQANKIFVLFHPEFWNADDAIAFIERVWQFVVE